MAEQLITTTPFYFRDFSGGITDNFLKCRPNQYKRAENFLITVANSLKTRPGTTYVVDEQVDAGPVPLYSMFEEPQWEYAQRYYAAGQSIYRAAPSLTEIQSPSSSRPFTQNAPPDGRGLSWAFWRGHTYVLRPNVHETGETEDAYPRVIINKSDNSSIIVRLGLPEVSTGSISVSKTAGAANYVYYFTYAYSYTLLDGTTFEWEGPATSLAVASASPPNTNAITLSNLAYPTDSLVHNYDLDDVYIKIYRTTDGGTVPYFVSNLTLGAITPTELIDTDSDATITARGTVLYIEGGVLDNDPPPKCSYMTECNDCLWFAEGSTIYQSKPGQPYAVPGDNTVSIADSIKGLDSIGRYPIVFGTSSIYRVEGQYDELGRGTVVPNRISDTIGTISNDSIVAIPQGLLFASESGFYFTDGYQVVKISDNLDETFKNLSSDSYLRIRSTYDIKNNLAMWAMSTDLVSEENDTIFVLHLRYGLKPESVFTTWTGYNFTSLHYHVSANQIYFGIDTGFLLKFSETETSDLKVSTTTPSNWNKKTIIYSWQSAASDLGTEDNRKWVPVITAQLARETNASILIRGANDGSSYFRHELKEIRVRDMLTWGSYTPDVPWSSDSEDYPWNDFPNINAKRRFPTPGVRCFKKQVEVTNAFTNIENSDNEGTGTVSVYAGTEKYLAISGAFPSQYEAVDYYVSFEADDYTENYLITTYTGTGTIIFNDPSDEVTVGSGKKWVIRGYPKGEICHILNVALMYAVLTPTQDTHKGTEGGNA